MKILRLFLCLLLIDINNAYANDEEPIVPRSLLELEQSYSEALKKRIQLLEEEKKLIEKESESFFALLSKQKNYEEAQEIKRKVFLQSIDNKKTHEEIKKEIKIIGQI